MERSLEFLTTRKSGREPARDERPWGGGAPPEVAFTYAPDRVGPDIQLAYCWAHARRKLVEITRSGSAPIAE